MFEIDNCAATVTNVNMRKENHGEEREPAFDINFNTRVHAECIKGLWNDSFLKAMWEPEGKALNVLGIEKITMNTTFENGTVVIKEGTGHKTTYLDCKIKKFKIRPRELQMVELWFQIQYQPEHEDEIIPAYRCLKLDEGVQVTVTADTMEQDTDEEGVQEDAFPNGAPEQSEPDPFAGSDLEGFPDELH